MVRVNVRQHDRLDVGERFVDRRETFDEDVVVRGKSRLHIARAEERPVPVDAAGAFPFDGVG